MSRSNTKPGERLTIDSTNTRQRWRYQCPRGHCSWEPTNHHFWCQECAQHWSGDAEFDLLVDAQTGDVYQRDEVEIEGYRAKSQ